MLGSLWLHGTFNAYNDTFIYICHGQWLQGHGFLEPAHTDGGHPAWGTVVYLREVHLRMGTSFLLGWVQAMFGREWSYEVFPLVSALGVICGALGVGATVLAACPGRWLEAWLAAMATAVTANGFVFGATNGFLPQTWGLAFVSAAVGLRGLELGTRAQPGSGAAWKTGVPFGVCVAAMMQFYWDLLPLAGPALASAYLLPWPGRSASAWRAVWARAWPPALVCSAAGERGMAARGAGTGGERFRRGRQPGGVAALGFSRARARIEGVGVGEQRVDHAGPRTIRAARGMRGGARVDGLVGGFAIKATFATLAANS